MDINFLLFEQFETLDLFGRSKYAAAIPISNFTISHKTAALSRVRRV